MGLKGEFTFLYPWVLGFLILVPGLVIWFLVQQRRYWRDALSFSQVSLVRNLRHLKHQALHQRVLPLFLVTALMAGIVGMAHPTLVTRVATQNSYLMLVLDISISMEANDLSPNRLDAAKKAAIEFARELPDGVMLGLTFFAGNTYLVSPPTDDHKLIAAYLNSLTKEDLRPGTAVGDALLLAMDSLGMAIRNNLALPGNRQNNGSGKKTGTQKSPGTIILLTDGESNLGVSPYMAVEEAIKQGVTVFTVGVGEETGAYVRGGIFTHLDESTLMTIAQQTGGTYYRARSFGDFRDIYTKISRKTLVYEEKQVSLMPWFLGATLVLVLGGFAWSVHRRRF